MGKIWNWLFRDGATKGGSRNKLYIFPPIELADDYRPPAQTKSNTK